MGYRPAVVISNNFFNVKTNMTIVCPITNTGRNFPLHIMLDSGTETTGYILCEQLKSVDLRSRKYKVIERLPDEILERVVNVVCSQIITQ